MRPKTAEKSVSMPPGQSDDKQSTTSRLTTRAGLGVWGSRDPTRGVSTLASCHKRSSAAPNLGTTACEGGGGGGGRPRPDAPR